MKNKPESAAADSAPTKAESFEHALRDLEAIVRQLEDGDQSLDESLALYEKGIKALRVCHQRLDQAEQRIKLLTANPRQPGQPELKDAPELEEEIRSGAVRKNAPQSKLERRKK